MTHDWRPISDVHEDSRLSLTLFAENGKVQSRASKGCQYDYDPVGAVAAIARIVERIRRNPLLLLDRPDTGFDLKYAICYDEDPKNAAFTACVRDIVGARFPVTPIYLAECLQIQNEELQAVDIVEFEIEASDLISQQWLHSARGQIDWTSSMIAWRCGARNGQFRRCGYDVQGIEFDYAVAKELGCRLRSAASSLPPASSPAAIADWMRASGETNQKTGLERFRQELPFPDHVKDETFLAIWNATFKRSRGRPRTRNKRENLTNSMF